MNLPTNNSDISGIRIKERSWLARIAAWKLKGGNAALVLGRTIHLYNISKESFLANERLLKHELCHVRQYKQYGMISFLSRYLWESIRKGYYNNRFEVEARGAEEE